MSADAVETKLSAARTRLILDKPFLGALVLRLPMKEGGDWCKTTATDARAFYYNRAFIDSLDLAQTQFMLAHEALHCALSHFARRMNRVKWRWDLACDFAVNPLLLDEGLKAPPDMLRVREFDGLTAEEIYPLLDRFDEDDKTLDEHIYDDENQKGGDKGVSQKELDPQQDSGDASQGGQPQQGENGQGANQPPPLNHEERAELQVQWTQRLAGAAQQAMQAGKLTGAMARLVDHLLQPQLPWRMLLARYMTVSARDDYNYQRPSRREGTAILPSLRSSQVDIVVAVDTSGSIGRAEMQEFVSEVDAIKGQVKARISLVACDAELAEGAPWVFEPWEQVELPKSLGGGGGTRFEPVFDWARDCGKPPDLLVYFTDAVGSFPPLEPSFPVIWLVKGRAQVPWGQRIQLN
ncbi:MAG: DUF2201 family putative metallopeptidase [Gammaproteobacteria bacterium]